MAQTNTYNPYDMLKRWDKLNGYQPTARPDKFTAESAGNLYLQTVIHKDYRLEQAYMSGKLKFVSADEFFLGSTK